MTYKNLDKQSDTREAIYIPQWHLTSVNHLELIVVANRKGYDEQIQIVFDTIVAMQSRLESAALNSDGLRDDSYRGPVWSDPERGVIWEVESSFWKDVQERHMGKNLRHYYVVTDTHLLDILSETEPMIKHLEKDEWRYFR